jgi:hypothetical protein
MNIISVIKNEFPMSIFIYQSIKGNQLNSILRNVSRRHKGEVETHPFFISN